MDTPQIHTSAPTTNLDPRHEHRVEIMQQLFAYSFEPGDSDFKTQFANNPDVIAIIENLAELDEAIQSAAPERPLAGVNKIDLAILRLSVFESRRKKTPKKVLINEAIELAKAYGTESSPRFVNGVLATVFEL